ncbi:hypothetical protein PGH26_06475 [Sporosarcina jeotgali]|uniref:Stage III sporulation protein AG n=1 Tax=Sporosarcina jeotgali TaxID=3020056 RepID=A0ABZ0KZC2_9BACL|nr:hypothetical protein [Sporosarcina sp. B2O-1]WOV85575.1 hypothetical protein PGH26_06475 [Sporosarcina sp. B2O-1]
MQKPTGKMQVILFIGITVLVFILLNPPWNSDGATSGKSNEKEGNIETTALESALEKIDGVGEVSIYLHPPKGAKEQSPLTDYFTKSADSITDEVTGVLVVAEGAGNPGLKSELTRILAAVLQLPEHRIVIVEMTKRGNYDENK